MTTQFPRQLIVILLISAITGCNNNDDESLSIIHNDWPGFEPLSLAGSKNFYRNADIKIFRSPNNSTVIDAFNNNIADVAAVTLSEAIQIQSQINEQIVIIAILDISHGGDVIIANKDIKNILGLNGKRLGVAPTAFGAYFVSRAIDSESEISLNNVHIVPVTFNDHQNYFLSKKIDAVATYEPTKSKILKQNGHVIFDSSQIPKEIIDVLITRNSLIKLKQGPLTQLLDGYFAALNFMQEEPETAIAEMAGFENIGTEEYKKSLAGLHIPGREENLKWLQGNNSQLGTAAEKLMLFLKKNNIIKSNSASLPLIDNQFVASH